MQRIMEDIGIDRISDDAKEQLREHLEAEIKEITRKAHQFAKHANRKTIIADDVKLASK